MKSWVKLYTEIVEDPDQGTLTLAQRGVWSLFLALCGRLDDRDEHDAETGRLDTPARVAWHLRCPLAEVEDAVAAFVERGMVEVRDGVVWLTHYADLQKRAPSSAHERVAERVKRHRNEDVTSLQAQGNEDVTRVQRGVTPSESDTDTEQSRAERAFRATRALPDQLSQHPLAAQYATEIGVALETHAAEVVRYALDEAVGHNGASWSYVEAILARRAAEDPPPRASPDPPPRFKALRHPVTGEIMRIDPQTGKVIYGTHQQPG